MSAPELRYRLAVAADAAALGEFMARNFLAAYGHCSTPENIQAAIAEHYGEAAQLRQIRQADCWNLIASAGDTWAGHAQLKSGGEAPAGVGASPALELSRFYVDVAYHGQGVAQAMMAQVKAHARQAGARALYLSVWQQQPQAIRFYRKEGFEIAGELVFLVGDDPKDDWLMVCPLA
jgi:ribosomal protein S18 acetylase RimI-like enzyme